MEGGRGERERARARVRERERKREKEKERREPARTRGLEGDHAMLKVYESVGSSVRCAVWRERARAHERESVCERE